MVTHFILVKIIACYCGCSLSNHNHKAYLKRGQHTILQAGHSFDTKRILQIMRRRKQEERDMQAYKGLSNMSRGTCITEIFFINVNIRVSRKVVRTMVGGVGQQSGKKAWVAGYLTRIRIVFHITRTTGHKGS